MAIEPDSPHRNVGIKVGSDPELFVALKDGETYETSTGGATEEGFDKTLYAYRRDGLMIHLDVSRQAQDCDGRMNQNRELVWSITDGALTDNGFPVWEEIYRSTRNFQAEQAEY